jgi:hypothetical protein
LLLGASTLSSCALVVGIDDHYRIPGAALVPDAAAATSGIALVQSTVARSTTVAFARPVTEHNTIIVAVDVTPASATPAPVITDSLQNRYAVVAGPYSVSGALQLYLAAAFDVAGGTDNVTVTWSGAPNVDLYIHEYAGLAAVDAIDGTSTARGTSSDADSVASASVTVTAPNELLFAFVGADSADVTVGSGFYLGVTFIGNLTEDRVIEQPGTYQATATVTTSGYAWGVLLAAFKGK